jgi:hypothetical protein
MKLYKLLLYKGGKQFRQSNEKLKERQQTPLQSSPTGLPTRHFIKMKQNMYSDTTIFLFDYFRCWQLVLALLSHKYVRQLLTNNTELGLHGIIENFVTITSKNFHVSYSS